MKHSIENGSRPLFDPYRTHGNLLDDRTRFLLNNHKCLFHAKRLLSKIALFVIFSTTSIPLGLLQMGIWANMFDEFYEETKSITLSAEWTFDGLHRCSGCELVDELGSRLEGNYPPAKNIFI